MEQTSTPTEGPTLSSTVGTLAHALDSLLSSGDVAELRRLRPTDLSVGTFWRVSAAYLSAELPPGGQARDEAEVRWAAILQALAVLRGLHSPRATLGQALAGSGVTEVRALKLLRAQGSALHDQVRILAHHLAASAAPVNCTDFAHLILSDPRSDRERVRRRIARDFYFHLEKETTA